MRTFNKPDFICVGPTKTGTTWLFHHLSSHPEVWLPPPKEMHYYWGMGRRSSGRRGFIGKIKQKLLVNLQYKWRYQYFKQRWRAYQARAVDLNWDAVSWDLKYLFLPQSPAWYARLLDKPLVTGDITGGYYCLGDEEITRLHAYLPEVKIILTLRDPVERLWSEARMHLLALPHRKIEDVTDAARATADLFGNGLSILEQGKCISATTTTW